MKSLLKNYLLLNRKSRYFFSYLLFLTTVIRCQNINYINNGSFEEVITNSTTPNFYSAKYWGATDSLKFYGELLSATTSPIKIPLTGYTYQWPRTGANHLIGLQFCTTCPSNKRGYPRNRLKRVLKANTAYCFSMYVNLSNQSTHAIDALGAYFGDGNIDTINLCYRPITYLVPQVENSFHNIITDTLNWVLIRGVFTANGTEKYCMIGNFKTDSTTNKILVNPTNLPANASAYLIDDVSLIESDLPAFAGRDTSIFAGDSIYLGRESDIGIDEACQWYKLPTAITPTTPAIDTIAGFWLKPTVTETYVVRQEICGNVKWDTVSIYMNAVGLEKLKIINIELKLFPIPTQDELQLSIYNIEYFKEFQTISIHNSLGVLIREEEINSNKIENKTITIKTDDLPSGVYSIQLKTLSNETISKRFVIAR